MADCNYYRGFRGGVIGGQSAGNSGGQRWAGSDAEGEIRRVSHGHGDSGNDSGRGDMADAQELPDDGVFVDELGCDYNHEAEWPRSGY